MCHMFANNYADSISVENILATWKKFLRGKRHKKDVMIFGLHLAENLSMLYRELVDKIYVHGPYKAFNVSDPKPRSIHKASVKDRVVHYLLYSMLYPYFDARFIYDSYSCRKEKGTHRARDRFVEFARKVSQNNTRTCFVLKGDIRKFFASIDHAILLQILKRHIANDDIIWLLEKIIKSFCTTQKGVGLPLGNLTSQLLVNIYMHEFDMYIKQELREKYYVRYADDFVILSEDREHLENAIQIIRGFLTEKLYLSLHGDKTYIKTYASGVDFLGWVHFPRYRILRTSTKKRIIKNMQWYPKPETVSSYRGLLQHGNTYKIQKLVGLHL